MVEQKIVGGSDMESNNSTEEQEDVEQDNSDMTNSGEVEQIIVEGNDIESDINTETEDTENDVSGVDDLSNLPIDTRLE